MPTLINKTDADISVAQNFVYAPGYTLVVANLNAQSVLPDGWAYSADGLTRESFPAVWTKPSGAQDSYANGAQVYYNGKIWQSLIVANVWQPGVSGWREVTSETGIAPTWVQPTGAHDTYQKGAVVAYQSQLWQSTLDTNVWEPGVYGWVKYSVLPPPSAPQYPAWVQPTGAQDAYALDAQVTHNGKVWKSLYASNVWEPGVFGWTQL